MTTLYKIEQLTFSYDTNHSKLQALSGLSLSIKEGERLAILGKSGSGKSTLLKLLHGLLSGYQGQILYKGQPLTSPPKEVSFLLQSYGLFPWKTVEENLKLPLLLSKKDIKPDLITSWLERLGLTGKNHVFPKDLSGGQNQRLALGRAMITSPTCLLLDEPFSALDTLTRESLQAFTLDLAKENETTLILVTHSIEEAIFLSTHLLIFTDTGHIYLENPLEDIQRNRANDAFHHFSNQIRQLLEKGV